MLGGLQQSSSSRTSSSSRRVLVYIYILMYTWNKLWYTYKGGRDQSGAMHARNQCNNKEGPRVQDSTTCVKILHTVQPYRVGVWYTAVYDTSSLYIVICYSAPRGRSCCWGRVSARSKSHRSLTGMILPCCASLIKAKLRWVSGATYSAQRRCTHRTHDVW